MSVARYSTLLASALTFVKNSIDMVLGVPLVAARTGCSTGCSSYWVFTGCSSYWLFTGCSSYWLFRAWGRVGTTIGGNKLESCGKSKRSAVDQFRDLYLEKTGNQWENRKCFIKQPNKFFPLDIDYGGVSAQFDVTSVNVVWTV